MAPERIALLVLLQVCSACSMLGAGLTSPAAEEEAAAAVRAQMSVKTALIDVAEVAAAPIRVQSEHDRVRLSGFVESEAEKRRAGDVARQAVPGLEVINDLRVWGQE
jgi:osmotically-inducible protein OsmY